MKKYLLMSLAFGIGSTAFAQGTYTGPSSVTPLKINPAAAKQKAQLQDLVGASNESFETVVNSLGKKTKLAPQSKTFTTAPIGTTEYQNQTNASICNRIVNNSDGTVSATWTFAADPAWADRGTGYNYFDGVSWGASPTVRIESVRTGFTNIGITGTNGEVIVCHEASNIHVSTRPVKGTGTWTEQALGFPDVWSRLSVGGPTGQTLHVISQTTGVGTTPYWGQDGAIAYSRSLDGGLTWDKLRTVIPQIDSSKYLGFGGDSYSIDANGSTIAIVAGGFDVDVVLIKSTDNGNTWTRTVVNDFGIPKFDAATMITDNNGDLVADTIETSDASLNVLLDASNNAHVFYGRMRVVCDVPGTSTGQGLSYFPYTDGLMYWNETMGASAPVMIAGMKDYNGDGLMNIYTDPTNAVLGMGTYQRSLTSFPSSGIDASGKLYLTYSSLFEGINDAGEGYDIAASTLIAPVSAGKSFRHQYVMRSDDNGATWCAPIDITQPDYTNTGFDYHEGVYGAMAKDVNGFVHVIVQDDQSPGHGVSTTTTPDPQSGAANIIYYKIPVADLACGASINEHTSSSDLTIYPNPASNNVSVVLNSTKATTASITVYNMVGQAVAQLEKNIVSGNNTVKLDISSFNTGVYFVSVIVDGNNYSQKLIVK
ncbi:MAG: T9SS type A sorting domain-containing protein [Bacteroidetes bacterium]|nr:T9SS type A sorting domain-containing protein [Bacteroidota bacterium]